MRPPRLLLSLASTAAVLLAALPAVAQPGGPPPPPPPGYGPGPGYGYYPPAPTERYGLTLGFGLDVGGMDSDSNLASCRGCDYDPAAVGFDFHIGGMINPRMAALFELWFHGQSIDSSGAEVLVQSMLMGALQYWLTPQFWIKGGLGFSGLQIQYDDGYAYGEEDLGTGLALMGAAGFEVLHSTQFAIDLQLRLGSGSYDGIDEQVNVAQVGIGFNWY
jgi:hypothetical protein